MNNNPKSSLQMNDPTVNPTGSEDFENNGNDGTKIHTVVATRGKVAEGIDQECLEVAYSDLKVIRNGLLGDVHQSWLLNSNELVIKKKILHNEQIRNRELEILRQLDHCNIVQLKYFFFDSDSDEREVHLNLLLEYVPETICSMLRYYETQKQQIPLIYVKLFMYQLFRE